MRELPDEMPETIEDLPTVLPVFPLAAPLLLPGTVVPLCARDWGQSNLLEDVWDGDRFVAVVQPLTAGIGDEIGDVSEPDAPLFEVGCLGLLGEVGEDDDDEPVGLAWGAVRFRIVEELPPILGYRRIRVDYSEFRDDLDRLRAGLEFPALKAIVRQRIEDTATELDAEITDRMMGTEIVTALAHAIAFSAAERQFLMETPSLHDLETVLLGLMKGPGGYLRFDQPPLSVS
jgi:Lon protease-like protein